VDAEGELWVALGLVAAHRPLVQACGVDVPDVRYVRNGGVALAHQVFGSGPIELVYVPQWINNLELAWRNPLFARFLNQLGSFARVVFVDRRGMGLSDRLSATDVPPLETLMEDLRVVIDSA